MSTHSQTAQAEIRKNIIELFEIEKLPEDQRQETINQIGKIIFQSVLLRILPLLDDEELAAYDTLMDGGATPDEALDFFAEKVPSFMGIVAEETENFRKDAAQFLKQLGAQ